MTGIAGGQEETAKARLLSIVVPAYNEALGILEFNRRLSHVRQGLSLATEVVFVNDGSTDDTLALLTQLRIDDPTIGIVDLSRNFGKEIALTAGLDHAHGDAVIILDADLQHPPELIPDFIERWQKDGADVVYGLRASRTGETIFKRLASGVFYRAINLLSDRLIPIDAGDFRLMSRRAVDALQGLRERRRFMKGLFAWIGYRQVPLRYEVEPRIAGRTNWNYWRLWNFSIEGITSFSIGPLKIATYIGISAAILALIYAFYVVVQTIIFGNPVPGYPTLLVLILFMGGLQLIVLGIIGEYLGRTYEEVKCRPLYLVKKWNAPIVDNHKAS
jgi:glycosyltransferase involved in cell wall biosynthesis